MKGDGGDVENCRQRGSDDVVVVYVDGRQWLPLLTVVYVMTGHQSTDDCRSVSMKL